MKILNVSLLSLLLLLSTSCATIFLGTREKIEIKTNVQGAEVKLNEKDIQYANQPLKISKRIKKPKIEVFKEGYETQTFEFTRSLRMGWLSMKSVEYTLGGTGIMLGGLFSAIIDGDASGPILLGSGAALVIPAIVDDITKADQTFTHNELNFDLIPVPRRIEKDSLESIKCSSVNLKIKSGTDIITFYKSKNSKFIEDSKGAWQETSNIEIDEFIVQVNNSLNDLGYLVPGFKDKFKAESSHSRFMLDAEIDSIQLSEYPHTYSRSRTTDRKCKTSITWALYDNFKKEVIIENTIETTTIGNNKTFKLLLFQSLEGSLKKFIIESNFNEILYKTSYEIKEVNEGLEVIQLDNAHVASEKISGVVQSSITIDLGDVHGSGFIISKTGYALTNYHVVGEEKNVNVILSSGISLKAEVIRTHIDRDVALLKIQGSGFKPVKLNIAKALAGDEIYAIGTPGKIELGQSITKGIISGQREIEGKVFFQTDVSVSPGSSGGPIVNENNEVVGIVNSKLMGQGVEGIGFAIPIAEALEVLNLAIH